MNIILITTKEINKVFLKESKIFSYTICNKILIPETDLEKQSYLIKYFKTSALIQTINIIYKMTGNI